MTYMLKDYMVSEENHGDSNTYRFVKVKGLSKMKAGNMIPDTRFTAYVNDSESEVRRKFNLNIGDDIPQKDKDEFFKLLETLTVNGGENEETEC